MMKKIQIHIAGPRKRVELASKAVAHLVFEMQEVRLCEISLGEITLEEPRKTKKTRQRKPSR